MKQWQKYAPPVQDREVLPEFQKKVDLEFKFANFGPTSDVAGPADVLQFSGKEALPEPHHFRIV